MDTGLARTPVNNGFIELPTGRPALTHRPPPPRPLPLPPSSGPRLSVPPAPGRRTPAGWTFLDGPSLPPTTAGFVVEVGVDNAGFRVADRPTRPAALAAHLATAGPADRPLLLVPSGAVTSAPAMTLLIGSLADALGRPLILADPGTCVTAIGLALGSFRRFHPRAGRAPRRIDNLGPALPLPFALRTYSHPPVIPGVSRAGASAAFAPVNVPLAAVQQSSTTVPSALAPLPARPGTPFESSSNAPTPAALPTSAAAPPDELVTAGPSIVEMATVEFTASDMTEPATADLTAADVTVAGPKRGASSEASPAHGGDTSAAAVAVPKEQPAPMPAEGSGETVTMPAPIDAAVVALLAPRQAPAFQTLAGPPPATPPAMAEPVALTRPVSAPPVPAPAPNDDGPAPAALWLPEAAPVDADRNAVRQALNGRYDAHARIVARRLSEDPGLRAVAGSAADITAGLVAVRAYLLEEGDTVNRVLRGRAGGEAEQQHAGVLARTATYGLHRLPSVFGPVFHAAAVESSAVSGYRPGDELVEPAFLDVELMPPAPDEETSVEIAIWSVSARRVSGLDVGDAAALFPPGSRFAVLAVDRPEEAPPRVLLRDLSSTRRGGGDDLDRILSRLRDAPRRGRATGRRSRSRTAPGLDDNGRRYRRPADDSTAADT